MAIHIYSIDDADRVYLFIEKLLDTLLYAQRCIMKIDLGGTTFYLFSHVYDSNGCLDSAPDVSILSDAKIDKEEAIILMNLFQRPSDVIDIITIFANKLLSMCKRLDDRVLTQISEMLTFADIKDDNLKSEIKSILNVGDTNKTVPLAIFHLQYSGYKPKPGTRLIDYTDPKATIYTFNCADGRVDLYRNHPMITHSKLIRDLQEDALVKSTSSLDCPFSVECVTACQDMFNSDKYNPKCSKLLRWLNVDNRAYNGIFAEIVTNNIVRVETVYDPIKTLDHIHTKGLKRPHIHDNVVIESIDLDSYTFSAANTIMYKDSKRKTQYIQSGDEWFYPLRIINQFYKPI